MSHSTSCLSILLFLYSILLDPIHCKRTPCDVFGVHPDECDKYSEKKQTFFYCGGDKEKALPFQYVNDDYCDCVGSNDDEPGTSACNGKFWCTNIGYRGRYIYSSLVNDGLCDCCDGSDEINNDRVKCRNTCKDKAKEELQDIIQQKKKYMEGIKLKNSLLQIAKSKINEKENKKKEIEKDLEEKRAQLKEKEEIKNIAERKEKEHKDEKNRRKEEERAKKEEERKRECQAQGHDNCDEVQTENDEIQTDSQTDDDEDDHEDLEETEETPAERRRRERREHRERRQEQRLKRKREQQERRKAHQARANAQSKEREEQFETEKKKEVEEEEKHHEHTPDEEFPYPEQYRPHDEIETESNDAEVDGTHQWLHTTDEEFPYPEQYRPHEEEENDGFDWSQYDEDEEEEEMYEMTWNQEEDQEEEDHDDVLDGLSDNVRDAKKVYNDLNREIRNLENDLSDISAVLNTDFGVKNVYASLLGDCYSTSIDKYNYEFCPFGNAKQKDGGSSTDLGSFKSFGVNDNGEIVMVFEGGQKCWNGPKRGLTVSFKCETENEIASVNEPSTCRYSMVFETPLACKQEELDKLTDLIQNQFKTEL